MDKNNEIISVEALQRGDREAFAHLVDAYSQRIYNLALSILGDEQDAEDVLQETFIKALGGIKNFEGRSSLSTWLYRIATNEALMLIRRRKPEKFVPIDEPAPDEEDDYVPEQIVDFCCMPEAELLSGEAQHFMKTAVTRLSPALRTVFILRDLQGLSIKETAEILSITEETVKTRLLRARLKLRDDLSGYYGERMAERSENE